jgi:hypothetical protein
MTGSGRNIRVDRIFPTSGILEVDGKLDFTDSLGIGTELPQANLHVVGNAYVSSNLEIGQANLFVDTTSSRVGVGTTEPDATLHVDGNAYVSSNLEVGQANLFVDTQTSKIGVGTTEPDATLHVVGNAYVSSNLEVGQANLFVDTTSSRVGVGTTEPDATLHVVGNAYVSSNLEVGGNITTHDITANAFIGDGSQLSGIAIIQGNTTWSQVGQDIEGEHTYDYSGYSVAMSSNGFRIAIGARFNDGNGDASGHVRVYDYNTSTSQWIQVGQDIDGEAAGDYSGQSVAISSDGSRIAIGAPLNDGNGDASGHVRVYDFNGSQWVQVGQDIDGEAAEDESGSSVTMSSNGSRIAIGAPYNGGNGDGSGHVRVYDYDTQTSLWTQVGQDIDGEYAGDYSGQSVAMSSDGSRIAIGAPNNYDPSNYDNGRYAGHVRVYDYNTSTSEWDQVGQDIDGEGILDYSGKSVAISSDGSRVAIGARFNDDNVPTRNNSGHVRVYDYNGSQWVQVGQDIDGEDRDDYSGHSVTMSSDGSRIAIGGTYNDGINGINSGHVRVYDYDTHTSLWIQVGQDIDGEDPHNQFGHSVAMSSVGSRIAIGAILNRAESGVILKGHVRVYDYLILNKQLTIEDVDVTVKSLVTDTINAKTKAYWNQIGQDIGGEAASDNSGESVAMSSDGSRIAIGASSNDNANGDNSGHVRVYDYNTSTSQWIQVGQDIDGEAENDYSGESVAMSSDGSRIAISASYNDDNGSNSGHVRVYDYNTSTSQWIQVGQDIDGEAESDYSGHSVTMSSDGSRIAIGARYNDGNNGTYSGHVRVYDYNGSQWVKVGQDIDGEAAYDESGWSVAMSSDGSRIAIGAPYNNGNNGTNSGHVRVYDYNGSQWVNVGQDIDGEAAYDESGWSVAISSDGSRIAIGARYNDNDNGSNSGHVRVYDYDTQTSLWVQVGQDIDGKDTYEYFGHSIAMSLDGSRIVIGVTDINLVRVYDYNTSTSRWIQSGDDIYGEGFFGRAIAISSDGSYIAIGATSGNGHVHVYKSSEGKITTNASLHVEGNAYVSSNLEVSGNVRITDGLSNVCELSTFGIPSWDETGYQTLSRGIPRTENFGYQVDIYGDYAIVGASAYDDSVNNIRGAAYIYKRNTSTGQWGDEVMILAPDGSGLGNIGFAASSVAISEDYAIVGAPYDDDNGNDAGAAYIFKRDTTTDTWDTGTKIKPNTNASAGRNFGGSVGIYGDYAVVAANKANVFGSVYIFKRDTTTGTWIQQVEIRPSEVEQYDLFPGSVAISGNYVIAGASYDDDEGVNYGAVYIFRRDPSTDTWDGGTKIVAPATITGVSNPRFGARVAISGNYAMVGALYDNKGSIHIFHRTGGTNPNTWDNGYEILGPSSDTLFGGSVAISGDTAIVSSNETGVGYHIFYFKRTDTNTWDTGTEILTRVDNSSYGSSYGSSFAVYGDYLIVGAPLSTDDSGTIIGAAYVHTRADVVRLNISEPIVIRSGTVLSFTGQHICFPEGPMNEGLVVSANKNKYVSLNGSLTTGSHAIKSSEALPIVSLSNVANDRSVFGVVDHFEMGGNTRSQKSGIGIITQDKEIGDNRVIVNALGEGAIWVTDTNGNVASGDFMTTSHLPGYAQRQDDDILRNSTVAKSTMECNFNPLDIPVQKIKKDENGTNILDTYGRLQWEDTDRTEKAYRVRYLTSEGELTDEANAVHIAAFIGCTYHCG